MTSFIEAYLGVFAGLIIFSPVILLLLWIYFLPWLTAKRRGHPNVNPILVLNLCLGWTILVWVGALAWAVCALDKNKIVDHKSTQSLSRKQRVFKYVLYYIGFAALAALIIAVVRTFEY